MENLTEKLEKRRIYGLITFSILFVFVSISTFYAIRTVLPMVTYSGRTSIYSIPAFLTYITPLIVFYLIMMSMYAKTIKGRLRFIYSLGLILLVTSIFNLVCITFCITMLWNNKVIVNMMTPTFALDVILINIVYLAGAICSFFYRLIDKKYVLSVGVSRIPLKTKTMVLAGFYIPFASYFFGECIFSFIYMQEGFIDPNWINILPHYLAFLLPGIYLGLYMFSRFQKTEQKRMKASLGSLIFIDASSLIVFLWIYISIILNPYLIAESMQWEYAIGMIAKLPYGLFILTLICVLTSLVASIKLIRLRRNKNEQEQAKI